MPSAYFEAIRCGTANLLLPMTETTDTGHKRPASAAIPPNMAARRPTCTARNDNSNAAGNSQETPGSPRAETEPTLQTQKRYGRKHQAARQPKRPRALSSASNPTTYQSRHVALSCSMAAMTKTVRPHTTCSMPPSQVARQPHSLQVPLFHTYSLLVSCPFK